MRQRRDSLVIMAKVVEAAAVLDKPTITRIQYYVGLPFSRTREYVNYLLKLGLLREIDSGRLRIFRPTERGLAFLSEFRKLVKMLGIGEYLGE
ncbi:MAG: hypothetical protein DRJ40_05975 [Thermoprotei archaeon]|nr:MAG: hypothetical protein DRJ40_05975 [Thermoprotei archaeon]